MLGLLLVGGCVASPHPTPPPIGYPFGGAGHVTADEQALLASAEDRLVADCMAGRGLAYLSRLVVIGPVPDNPYGLLAVADARAFGYGIADAAARRKNPDPNADFVNRMPPSERDRWYQALLGTDRNRLDIVLDDGGVFTYRSDACAYQAHIQVVGNRWDRTYMQVNADTTALVRTVQGDPAVGAAQSRWSACMRDRGHPAVQLTDARATAVGLPAPQEREIATTDARCQQVAGLGAAIARAASAVQAATAAPVQDRALQLRELRAAAAITARAVLRRGSG
ncbi:hypothetical protein [Micromonospora sp. RP3T]|uniref:hypothetical protein n=1 Tax=Micromonospora sp. RP3T TaxID=2135446 RepID=UPI0011B240F8|nr:hypothetical protein [Micromonospora sp. RP3T]